MSKPYFSTKYRYLLHFQTADGHLVGGFFDIIVLADTFLVDTGLYSASDFEITADGYMLAKSCVSSPGDNGNVIGFVVGAVDCQKQVANFTSERRCAVNRLFADKAV